MRCVCWFEETARRDAGNKGLHLTCWFIRPVPGSSKTNSRVPVQAASLSRNRFTQLPRIASMIPSSRRSTRKGRGTSFVSLSALRWDHSSDYLSHGWRLPLGNVPSSSSHSLHIWNICSRPQLLQLYRGKFKSHDSASSALGLGRNSLSLLKYKILWSFIFLFQALRFPLKLHSATEWGTSR